MSQTVGLRTVSPRALRSKNKKTSTEDAQNPAITKQASSTQSFQDALTGEEQRSQNDDDDQEGEMNALRFPQSNQNANKQALVFDQDNRLRRADPNQTPVRFPTKPVHRTQVEIEFDKNDSDTFLERLFPSDNEKISRQTQGSSGRSPKRYNLRAPSSSTTNAEKKRKSAPNQIWRLLRGSYSSEEVEEGANEEPGETNRQTGKVISVIGRKDDEEVDELVEEAEDEDMIAAELDLGDGERRDNNKENDDYVRNSENNSIDEDFEDRLNDDAIRAQKEEVLQRRQKRGEERERSLRESRLQRRIDGEESGSEIEEDDSIKRAENAPEKPRYRYTIGQNNVGRKRWTEEETACLMSALDTIMSGDDIKAKLRPYHAVLQLHGERGSIDNMLASRNNMQLKDKVRNEILRMKRSALHIPEWADLLFRTLV